MMTTRRKASGFSLIELMISMTIGVFLIGGALYVFDEANATTRVNESLARMQENARWALDTIEPDIRLSGYWGRHTAGSTIAGRANSIAPLATAVDPDCGPNWSINTDVSLEGFNNDTPAWTCVSDADHHDGSDTLAVRHASGQAIDTPDLENDRIYLRTHEAGRGALFFGTAEPAINDGQNNEQVAHAYYVRPNTFGNDGRPSLRRRGLTAGPAVIDQEIISGVEDLQVQFGIDNNADFAVDLYVNPDNALLATAPPILAVRIWLLMRADDPELGFVDNRTYVYADREFTPDDTPVTPTSVLSDYRRILVARTIYLRNESIMEGSL